jgi:hypothetical protein
MLRLETETGWWLVTHPDHARLAGAFAKHWGNERFRPPPPRVTVLKGIARHDDGWMARDAAPQITREGKPSAFSVGLVGKYSAFEEIDLADYLAVRDGAVRLIAEEDAYAALLISMHTYNLLSEHADRSTISPDQLPLLDDFLERQREFQQTLQLRIATEPKFTADETSEGTVLDHFRLLQAADNLSLLTCIDFRRPSHLLHPLPLLAGGHTRIEVRPVGSREFVLDPYPFAEPFLRVRISRPSRDGKSVCFGFEMQHAFASAPIETLSVPLRTS